jgi:hypothetical protein
MASSWIRLALVLLLAQLPQLQPSNRVFGAVLRTGNMVVSLYSESIMRRVMGTV